MSFGQKPGAWARPGGLLIYIMILKLKINKDGATPKKMALHKKK